MFETEINPVAHFMALRSLPSVSFAKGQCSGAFEYEKQIFQIKVVPYSFTIARALLTKAQVICAHSKENISVFRFL